MYSIYMYTMMHHTYVFVYIRTDRMNIIWFGVRYIFQYSFIFFLFIHKISIELIAKKNFHTQQHTVWLIPNSDISQTQMSEMWYWKKKLKLNKSTGEKKKNAEHIYTLTQTIKMYGEKNLLRLRCKTLF